MKYATFVLGCLLVGIGTGLGNVETSFGGLIAITVTICLVESES